MTTPHRPAPAPVAPAPPPAPAQPGGEGALEHVAHMTRTRDRTMVDATLLTAFMDLLPVRTVRLWRVLGEPGSANRQWLLAGHHRRGELVPVLEGLGEAGLPVPYASKPRHVACYEEVRVVSLRQGEREHEALLPMASGREVEGVVECEMDAALDAAGQRLAQNVLKIHRNFLGLLDYSERDTLTGLLNRKSFDETFLRATAFEAERMFAPHPEEGERRGFKVRRHWLGVIDIDHFKRVNDQHGHVIGDEVLLLVARIMRSTFRYDDRLYRFGGEEFVVLLTAPDDESAGIAFERLRRNLEDYPFPRVGRVTASLGYSDVRPGDTPQAAFERADRAVYHAKACGRNQVHSFARLLEQGDVDESGSVGEIELF